MAFHSILHIRRHLTIDGAFYGVHRAVSYDALTVRKNVVRDKLGDDKCLVHRYASN